VQDLVVTGIGSILRAPVNHDIPQGDIALAGRLIQADPSQVGSGFT
jgi:hypothetical protein